MYDRGDLLLVPVPFSDLSSSKRRPVVALTVPDGHGDFVAMPVTSRPQKANGLLLESGDLVQGSLPLTSWIRTDRAVTLNAALVMKSFGRVSETVLDAALEKLCDNLGH